MKTHARRTSKPPKDAFYIAEKHFRIRPLDSGGNQYPEVSKAFHKVLELAFPIACGKNDLTLTGTLAVKAICPRTTFPHGHFATIHSGDPKQREAMDVLWSEICKAIESAHQSGIERGKSLLIQLARGDITTSQLNDHAVKDG